MILNPVEKQQKHRFFGHSQYKTEAAQNTPVCKTLKCILFNSRSICNKIGQLHYLLNQSTYDIIFVTETWLNNFVADSLLLLNYDYSIIRCDRKNRTGGGVAIVFKKFLSLKNINLPNDFSLQEAITCDITVLESKYRFILCYRSPGQTDELDQQFFRYFEWSCNTSRITLVLGDFNFPEIKWNKQSVLPENSISSQFFELVNELGLHQLTHYPTLGNNILDLIFCSCKSFVFNVKNCEPFSTSDHDSLTFDMSI